MDLGPMKQQIAENVLAATPPADNRRPLPEIVFGDSLRLENDADSGGFGHQAEYDQPGRARKPYSSLPYSN